MSDTKLQEQVNEIKNRILRTESADWRNFAFTINQNLKDWQSSTAKEQLKASIKRGFLNTFNVWEDPETGNLECLDGKHRVDVLLELQNEGMSIPELLPTNFIECKDRKEAAKNVLIYSSFYAQITPIGIQEYSRINEIQIEKMPEINLPPMPIIEELEAIPIQHEAVEDDFDTTPPAVAKTVLGDLYEIGDHRVLCGDSCDSDAVSKLMNGERADMVFTSPPYNSGDVSMRGGGNFAFGKSGSKTLYEYGKDNKTSEEYFDFIISILNNINLVISDLHSIFWNVSYNANSRDDYGKIVFSNINPFKVKETIIWSKGSAIPIVGEGILSRNSELIFLMAKSDRYLTNQKIGENSVYWNTWNISSSGSQMPEHKACFPIELPHHAIQGFSKTTSMIFDPFLGSGSTMVAAHQLKRKCYGMEIDCRYTDVVIKRMLSLDSTLRVKRNGVDVTEEWRD